MAATNDAQTVATPPLVAPRISLLATAPIVTDDARWLLPGGVKFKPQRYTAGARAKVVCGTGTGPALTTTALVDTDYVDAGSFVAWASEQMSTFGLALDERRRRVLDQLAAIESYEIANELWTGGVIDSGSPDQRILRSVAGDTLTTAAVAPDVALGIIEAGLASLGRGQRGMVHVTPQTLTALAAAQVVRREGNAYLSPNDHWVVADAGYPGSGPAGHARAATSVWMYGTSMVRLRLGATFVIGADGDAIDPGTFDPDTNTHELYAVRPALIEWDEQVHVAAETNLTVPLVAGAS